MNRRPQADKPLPFGGNRMIPTVYLNATDKDALEVTYIVYKESS